MDVFIFYFLMNHPTASCRVSIIKLPLPSWEGIKGRVNRDFLTPTYPPPSLAGQARGRNSTVTL